MSSPTFTLSRAIQAPPGAVYRALTTATGLLDWLAHTSDVEARVGGRLYGWDQKTGGFLGQYTALEKEQRVAFALLAPAPAQVDVTLTVEADRTCLTLVYEGDAPEPAHTRWANAFDTLQAVLETGLDPRLYNRPMLGILISGLVDKETQERLQLPLDYGILIGGTLPGMGAEKVGFLDGDVLVELDGTPINQYDSIGPVIGSRNAGDSVHAVWYRGKVRHAADMILSGRPHPRIPATLAELAEEARQIYASLDGELAEILDEVPESAAEYRPAEHEWNVKEIIAHLINTERAMQIWLVNAVEGTLFQHWVSNNHHIVKSIVDVTPALPELVAELRRAEAQTVALLQRLPEEIVTHKGAFHNLVTTLNKEGLSVHTRLHFGTIKKLIDEAQM
ncbi:MAG: SRPBCC domain-containing protein [Anaerolineales bacterium]|nr:SRPBCC domain-containing protein [Anaerolineales bacterium]